MNLNSYNLLNIFSFKKNNITYNKKLLQPKIKYSVINVPFNKINIAIFMIIPGDKPDSG